MYITCMTLYDFKLHAWYTVMYISNVNGVHEGGRGREREKERERESQGMSLLTNAHTQVPGGPCQS